MLLRNVVPVSFNYQDLITLFNDTFSNRFNTLLIAGEDEPVYLPAGEQRRLLVDYGYWYEPDGRDAKLQAEFEKVEITPQAIEWALATSCGFKFDVSVDNLGGISIDRLNFKHKVHNRVMNYSQNGLSERAMLFINACQDFYHTPALSPEFFNYQGLGAAHANNIGTRP
jgi:elongation factor P hydroxylase